MAEYNSANNLLNKVEIPIASEELIAQIRNEELSVIDISVNNARSLQDKQKINASVFLASDLLQAAADEKKDINVAVKDDKGKELYVWSFDGDMLAGSDKKIENICLNLSVDEVMNHKELNEFLRSDKASSSDDNAEGLVIKFDVEGDLPAQTQVRVYVGDILNKADNSGLEENSIIYFYHYNKITGKLDTLPYSSRYKVDKDGYITVNLLHCSDYVILPEEADRSLITSLREQISITPNSFALRVGEKVKLNNRITIKLPSTMELINTLKDETLGSAVGAVAVSYTSLNKDVVTADRDGNLTAKGIGKAIILVDFILYNKKTKTIRITVNVKK